MKNTIWKKTGQELHPTHLFKKENLLPALVSGVLVGLLTTILSISFAVLVFGKAVPEALSIGIGMALVSNVVLHLCSAVGSSGEGIVAHVQSLPPPIQAAMLSALMGVLPISMPVENRVLLAVLAVLVSAVFTGAVLWVLGWLKLGRLVRFLPMPVVSGFLASVGFALVLGGMTTMTGSQTTLFSIFDLFKIDLIFKWLPGVLLAFVLWQMLARWKNVWVFPGILTVFGLLFYAFCFAKGLNSADLMARQLLLGPFQQGQLWPPPQTYFSQIASVDWTFILGQMGIIATIPLVSFIGGLLMVSAIEFATDSELEPNFELKAMGAGNIISGIAGGGFVGYPSTTFTVMQRSLGATTRLAGILSAAVPGLVLVAGAGFLGFIPRFMVGGLLIFFGYQFIEHWVVKQFRHSTTSDFSILAAIVVASLWLGFVASVGVGILAAAMFFLFKYSKISVVRYVSNAAVQKSRVTRNPLHNDWLSAHADCIAIFGLQGYIFFGTAHGLIEKIMSRVSDPEQPPLDSVILDFRHVTGIDSSVVQSFHKLQQQLRQQNIALVFAQIPSNFQNLMRFGSSALVFSDLDEALEQREDHLLKNSGLPNYQSRPLFEVLSERFGDPHKALALLHYLEKMNLPPGAKIIEQGRAAHDLFFIESGRVSTYLEQAGRPPVRLETMVDDTMVGEIGFYLHQTRTATVMADEPSVVYRLTTEALFLLEKEHPLVALELHRLVVEKTAKRVNHVVKNRAGF